jgi:hypothetical protein
MPVNFTSFTQTARTIGKNLVKEVLPKREYPQIIKKLDPPIVNSKELYEKNPNLREILRTYDWLDTGGNKILRKLEGCSVEVKRGKALYPNSPTLIFVFKPGEKYQATVKDFIGKHLLFTTNKLAGVKYWKTLNVTFNLEFKWYNRLVSPEYPVENTLRDVKKAFRYLVKNFSK